MATPQMEAATGDMPTLGLAVSRDMDGKAVLPESQAKGSVFNAMLIYSMVVFGASACLFGFDNGIIGPIVALPEFVDRFQGINDSTGLYVFTARNQDLLFSVPLVGSIFGALLGDPLQNRYGRKNCLVGAYVASMGGVFLQLFAPNLAAFIIGRSWNSLSYGVALADAPLFLSEVVPAEIRGGAVQANNIFAIIANVIATAVIFGTSHLSGTLTYKVPLAVQCALPVVLCPLTLLVPESPVWLVTKNRMEEARRNLRKLRGFSDAQVDDELRVISESVAEERALAKSAKFVEIFYPANIKRTLAGGSLFSLNQISGIILSTTYATVFLTQLGVGSPFLLTMVAALTQLAGSCTAPFVIDRAGRRPLALVGFTSLLVLDIIAGTLAFYTDRGDSVLKAIAAMSFLFNFCWCCSFYALSLLVPTEIPTPRLRTATTSYAIAAGQTTAVITTFAVPQLVDADAGNLGAKTYLVFAGCMVFCWLFCYFLLPETKGRTFAEIDEMYADKIPFPKWKNHVCRTTGVAAPVVSDMKVVETRMEDEKQSVEHCSE